MPLHIIDGMIHSPFFIFVRCVGLYSDREILDQLGLGDYATGENSRLNHSNLYITDDANWVHIADDFYYSLWDTHTIRDAIANLGQRHEVYSCSAGDSDDAYDYVYYRDGALVRKFVVEDRNWKGGKVCEDVGSRLPGEPEPHRLDLGRETMIDVAMALGIEFKHDAERVRTYRRPFKNGCPASWRTTEPG